MPLTHAQWRRQNLEQFVAEFASPMLKVNGYRKSARVFKKYMANGDQVAITFWLDALPYKFSFSVFAEALQEPVWDMHTYQSGKTYRHGDSAP